MVSIAVFLSFAEPNRREVNVLRHCTFAPNFIIYLWTFRVDFVLFLFVRIFVCLFLHFGKQFTSFLFLHCSRRRDVFESILPPTVLGSFCWHALVFLHRFNSFNSLKIFRDFIQLASFYLFKVFLSISLFIIFSALFSLFFFFVFVHSTWFHLNRLYTLFGHFIVWF